MESDRTVNGPLRPSARYGEPLGNAAPWPAPAKLNLCLHVIGRREDGYHLLQTAFQLIDLADELRFFRRPSGVIERVAGPRLVPSAQDLTMRAARALLEHAGSRVLPGVAIATEKRIPLGGGLGGGSSDAATVLVALNRLLGIGATLEELARIGLSLGADVPVFVHGRSAWGEGIGERLTFVDWPERDYVVVQPGSAIATADVFQAPELTRNSAVTTIRDFLAYGGRNDCEPVVRARFRGVAEALDFLARFGKPQLTGTGAGVFLPVADRALAAQVLAALPDRWQGFLVRGVNRSPLHARAAREAARQ